MLSVNVEGIVQFDSGCRLIARPIPECTYKSQGVLARGGYLQELTELASVMCTIDNGCPILLVILGLCA